MPSKDKAAFIKLDANGVENGDAAAPEEVPKKRKGPVVASGSRAAMDEQGRGVIYLSHIPHGFYEKQMYKFFSQVQFISAVKVEAHLDEH